MLASIGAHLTAAVPMALLGLGGLSKLGGELSALLYNVQNPLAGPLAGPLNALLGGILGNLPSQTIQLPLLGNLTL